LFGADKPPLSSLDSTEEYLRCSEASYNTMPPRPRLSYFLLALLRILIAFTSHSFIHPDEHFQNPEVAAGGVFDIGRNGEGLLRTWEWTGDAPCRSIVPVWMSTWLSFAVLKVLDPRTLSSFYLRRRR
jgi:hypothetical protein